MKLALGEFTWDEPAARLHPFTLPPFHPSTLPPSSRHPVIPSSPRPLIPAPPVRQPDGQRGADALLVSSSDVHDGPACQWLLAAVTATAFVVRAVAARVCPCPCPCLPGMAARWSAVIPPGPRRSPSILSFFFAPQTDRRTAQCTPWIPGSLTYTYTLSSSPHRTVPASASPVVGVHPNFSRVNPTRIWSPPPHPPTQTHPHIPPILVPNTKKILQLS